MIYKVLSANGTSCHGGDCRWSLPTRNDDGTWTPGEWMPAITGDLVACENGYHLCVDAQVIQWLNEAIYEAEFDGERIDNDDKIVVRRARLLRRVETWNADTARTFARWCALQVAHLWNMPDVVRKYLETGDEKIMDAAWDASWDAARDASWAAARAASWAAARAAVWDAARAASWDASWDASRDVQYAEFCRLTTGRRVEGE